MGTKGQNEGLVGAWMRGVGGHKGLEVGFGWVIWGWESASGQLSCDFGRAP